MKYLLILFLSATLFATDFYVSKTGSNVPPYNSWANASTNIQAVLDYAATSEPTIFIKDGTYDERINVHTNATIIGESKENTIIGKGVDFFENGKLILTNLSTYFVEINGIEKENVSAEFGNCKLLGNRDGINVVSGNVELVNCDFTFSDRNGIYCVNGNVKVINSRFNNNDDVYCLLYLRDNSSLYMYNCQLSNNVSKGIIKYYSALPQQGNIHIENCRITDNNSSDYIIYFSVLLSNEFYMNNCYIGNNISDRMIRLRCLSNGVARIYNSTFENNRCENYRGGALYNSIFDNIISNCIFRSNFADNEGGAICGSMRLYNCFFENNSANDDGGAIYIMSRTNAPSLVYDCKFISNSALKKYCSIIENRSEFKNCLFENNTGEYLLDDDYYTDYITNKFENCKFVNNNVSASLISIGNSTNYYDYFKNCLFLNNSIGQSNAVIEYHNSWSTNTISLENCTFNNNGFADIKNTYTNDNFSIKNCLFYNSNNFERVKNVNNITYSCLPKNYPGAGNIVSTNNNLMADGKLLPNSPCIDAGTNLSNVLFDYWGTQRPQGIAFDIGANEWFPAPWISGYQLAPNFDYLEQNITNKLYLACENLTPNDLHNAKVLFIETDTGKSIGTDTSYFGLISKNTVVTGMNSFQIYIPLTDNENAVLTVEIQADEGGWTNSIAIPIIPEPFKFWIFNFLFLILRRKLISSTK